MNDPRQNSQVVSVALDQTVHSTFDEDSVLVERFLAGESDAFITLYSKYHDKVLGIARGILLDPEEAADAVQEIFTLVYRNLNRFDRRSRFGTWIFRIAVNRSIQEARKNKNHKRAIELSEDLVGAQDLQETVPDPAINRALAGLQPPDRAILVLFYWEELSLQEIAASIGCGANAAKTRLYRARERFRDLYEEVQ